MSAQVPLHGPNEPVAIVGMGCRWAGGIRDPRSLWELLRNKKEGWREFDSPRFSTKAFHHPSQDRPGSIRTRGGFLVDEDARLFDHAFFGITGREVETMDPNQRKLLEVVYEALENGGETLDSISGTKTGVYIGNFAIDHMLIQARDWENPKAYAATGADTSILANRISYIFNLLGPSLATNTACSSSMYALHMAVSAIRNGECDGAIVAAANWISDPSLQIVLDKLGALSPTSRCHTFDVRADGYARGEGYAAIYLKKSSIAVLDSSPIRAMIRGTAVNANGRTGGITRPSASGQEAVIRQAYESAGDLPFSDTTFFEAHGTGTQAGDPIEVSAIGSVFASSRLSAAVEDRLLIGSIKTNLGHTEGASALASIMKVVLSLEAGEIPPSYGVENLNPNIDFDEAGVYVVKDRTIPWPANKLRRCSVNSFGFGGANGHCIIDHVHLVLPDYVKPGISGLSEIELHSHLPAGYSKPSLGLEVGTLTPPSPPGQALHSPLFGRNLSKQIAMAESTTRHLVLLPFSAHSTTSLKLNIDVFARTVGDWKLADVAYTLACKRSKLQQRTIRIVEREAPLKGLAIEQPVFNSPLRAQAVAFVFTGQGAQWSAMGARLFEYRVFKHTIAYLDHVLQGLPQKPSWSLTEILSGGRDAERVQDSAVSQPACTAVQIGLVDLLASWSVRPSAVVGHSSGEMAAAYSSGHITAAEAIVAAYFRGEAVSRNRQKGAMLAVGLGPDQAFQLLEGGLAGRVNIAAINSPGSVTLSGDTDGIDKLSADLESQGIFCRRLRTSDNAYHSHHMTALGPEYHQMLTEGLAHVEMSGFCDSRQRYPQVPWVSSVTPNKAIACEGAQWARYWKANLESPVSFSDAVTTLLNLGNVQIDVLVEIGPHGALRGPLEQIMKAVGRQIPYVSSLKRGEDDLMSILQLSGSLFGMNVGIDLVAVNATDGGRNEVPEGTLIHGCTAIDLPPYQYTLGDVLYHESRPSKDFRLRQIPKHDLLGSIIPGCSRTRPQWRNILKINNLPWLADHRLTPDAVFPAAGFLTMAMAAAAWQHESLSGAPKIVGYSLRNVDIKNALRVPEDDNGVEVMFSLELQDASAVQAPSWAAFAMSSVSSTTEEWNMHCTGFVKVDIADTTGCEALSTGDWDPRYPQPQSWYSKFKSIGIEYGPDFRRLSNICADPSLNLATATVALGPSEESMQAMESSYPLHPAALDATFQLGLIACHGGQTERAETSFVPVHFDTIRLKTALLPASVGCVVAHGSLQGLRGAYIKLQMFSEDGQVALDIETLRCISYAKSSELAGQAGITKSFSSPFTRLTWKPDFRTLSNEQIRAQFPAPRTNQDQLAALECTDLICCLIVADIYENSVRDKEIQAPSEELRHWIAWVRRCALDDERRNMVRARELTPAQRKQLLEDLSKRPGGDNAEAQAAHRLHESISDILNGTRTGIDVLVADGLLTALYQTGNFIIGAYPQLRNVMDSLSFANPHLRILEIGAGTGGATREAMKALLGPGGFKRYIDFTFTDVSAGFLASAQESMSDYSDMKFGVLDIEKDPRNQGYEAIYDVVLASQAIHATISMETTLKNIAALLKPQGKLIVVEATRMRVLPGLLYGTLTGYWLGADDGRSEGPFMELDVWENKLRQNGFSGVEMHLDDYPEPQNSSSVLVSTWMGHADHSVPHERTNNKLTYLLHSGQNLPTLLAGLAREIERRGTRPEIIRLGDAMGKVKAGSRIIAFLDGGSLLFDAHEKDLSIIQHLVRSATSMVWLTSAGLIKGRDPRASLVRGLLRTIGTENPVGRFLSIDIDAVDFDIKNEDLTLAILQQEESLQSQRPDDEFEDREFVWQDGCMWVSRVVPDASLEPYTELVHSPSTLGSQMVAINGSKAVCAAFETPGVLSSLYFRPYNELLRPLPADQIDVKVFAVGVNWKDLGLTSGRFDANGNNLSSEYVGTITQAGTDVVGLAVGDLVFGMGRGHFGNWTRVPAAFAQKLQSQDNPVEMATMPVVYMTAVYAFQHAARLQKGHKVLIQSATGGLGIAAIHLARHLGAEIYATVGNDEKSRFLVNSMDIPASHIAITTRDNPSAMTQMANAIGGFDVVLSTSTGSDMLYECIKSLAPMGHLVDVGRLDVLESKSVGLEVFKKSAHFSSFDLTLILDHNPAFGRVLMQTVDDLYRSGAIMPIKPATVASVSELDRVLSKFAKGTHIGKMVVSYQEPSSLVKLVKAPPAVSFDPKARYIITGGLGGLGRAIVRWMVGRGARDILVLSRRGLATTVARSLTESMAALGVSIASVVCDVTSRERVIDVIKEASADKVIKGLIHAAFTIVDLSFDKLSIRQWRDGTDAKVHGTINLHDAVSALPPLDFFVMTTTTESVWAPPTQGAYMAASHFQDVFARHRRSLGMCASTVAFGLVNDVLSDWRDDTAGTDDMYVQNKALSMTEHQMLAQLEPAILAFSGPYRGQDIDPGSTANLITCMDPAAMVKLQHGDDSMSPRWHNDGRVSHIMRALGDANKAISATADDSRKGGGQSATALLRANFEAAINTGPTERTKAIDLIVHGVTRALAEMLFVDEARVDAEKSVAEHGVDSLTAAELRGWFFRALGVDLRVNVLLDATTRIRALMEGIVDERLKG